jgi:hypothetical protein
MADLGTCIDGITLFDCLFPSGVKLSNVVLLTVTVLEIVAFVETGVEYRDRRKVLDNLVLTIILLASGAVAMSWWLTYKRQTGIVLYKDYKIKHYLSAVIVVLMIIVMALVKGSEVSPAFQNLFSAVYWFIIDSVNLCIISCNERGKPEVVEDKKRVKMGFDSGVALEEINIAERPPSISANNSKKFFVVATYDNDATEDNELAFQVHDIIDVIDDTDKGWWLGRNTRTGKTGMFPVNYTVHHV